MPRLSDRAFHIVKTEIERRYTDNPTDQIERVILLARLEALRTAKGAPMTRVQIWEVLSDVAPNFDQNVLMDAESVETDSPLLGVSVGVGAVAMLVATAIAMETIAPLPSATLKADPKTDPSLTENNAAETDAADAASDAAASGAEPFGAESSGAEPSKTTRLANSQEATDRGLKQGSNQAALENAELGVSETANSGPDSRSLGARFSQIVNRIPGRGREDALESAERLGWQAALKSQDPPHSAQHWKETAALWEQALAELARVPARSPDYAQAQLKKSLYQNNLKEIRSRQASAEQLASAANAESASAVAPTAAATPKFSSQKTSPTTSSANNPQTSQSVAEVSVEGSVADVEDPISTEDPINTAKRYGWQAALASQNAPHSPEKWADISRLWQTALSNLNKLEAEHPQYAEAQQIKAQYQQNLSEIRDRYQQEQNATQRLQSLQASLRELNNSMTPEAAKFGQMESITEKLRTIPPGTQAHRKAQQLIAETTAAMNAIAITPKR